MDEFHQLTRPEVLENKGGDSKIYNYRLGFLFSVG